MPKFPGCASVAAQALYAFRRGDRTGRESALARAERLARQSPDLDSSEAERIEALHGAILALNGSRQEQVQAGIYLLEHLASRPQIA